ncbi:nitrile hydratase subunit beta [Pseudonocardia phyllosphaerae]|uniref:nitrile hydratase subunit beta n=1 Tax=Pseudonocardia phyllosphaerae TaxID=3390502 RepID=UPI00397B9391
MDGVHDLAGKQGWGQVPHTANGPIGDTFKYDWEHLGYSLLFLGVSKGIFTLDEVRHSVERIEPRVYLTTPYYERYIIGAASLMVEKGVLTQDELETMAGGPFPLALPAVSPGRPAPEHTITFEVGDKVRVRDDHFAGHVRYPAFCRGKVGTVQHRTAMTWPFPDAAGHGRSDGGAEPSYHVEFAGEELFGDDTDAGAVVVDLFEGYLEPAV